MGKTIILLITLSINIFAQNKLFSEKPLNFSDTSFNVSNSDSISNNYRTHYTGINFVGQIAVGEVMGIGLSVLPLAAAELNSLNENSNEPAVDFWATVAISAYIFGVSAGVHLIAKSENKNHKLSGTLLYSAIGGAVSVIISYASSENHSVISSESLGASAIFPLIGALIYSLAIADWPQQNQETTIYEHFKLRNNIGSFKDLVNQSQIVKVNLFRISF